MGTNVRQPIAEEVDRLVGTGSIVAVGDKVVLEHRSTECLRSGESIIPSV